MITENAVDFFEQRESLFSSMAENCLTEMISLISVKGELIYKTPFIQKTTIASADKNIRPNGNIHYIPRGRAQSKTAFNESLANAGIPIIHYINIQKNDGTYIYLETSFTNMLHLNKVNAILIIDRDITKASLAEKKLKDSEELFRLLIESVKEYAIYMIDPTGYVLSWNLGAELIIGYSAKEIIGKHLGLYWVLTNQAPS